MKISKIKAKGYRNLKDCELEFSDGINYICGENGQGKTNLLEAVWMFTGARSFRSTKDENLVCFNKTCAKLEGSFFFEERNQEMAVCFANGKRKIFLNGIAQRHPTSVIGKFRTVLFAPVHLSLVKDGPDNRRKFLDAAICQLKPTYTSLIARYNQILKQRNALLKEIFKKNANETLLEVWDEKLCDVGTNVINHRMDYSEKIKPHISRIYSEFSGKKEVLETKYISTVSAETFKEKLKKSVVSDIHRGFTSVGPHKDEFEIFLQGKNLKQFGSQGQQRSAVLAMKLAEAEVLEEKTGEPCVILLDDVMSELDDYRKNYITEKIANHQVFITGCESETKKTSDKTTIFGVKNGEVVVV